MNPKKPEVLEHFREVRKFRIRVYNHQPIWSKLNELF